VFVWTFAWRGGWWTVETKTTIIDVEIWTRVFGDNMAVVDLLCRLLRVTRVGRARLTRFNGVDDVRVHGVQQTVHNVEGVALHFAIELLLLNTAALAIVVTVDSVAAIDTILAYGARADGVQICTMLTSPVTITTSVVGLRLLLKSAAWLLKFVV